MPQPVPCVFFFGLSILPASFLFDIFIISFYLSFKYPTCPEFSFSSLCSCPTPYFHSPSEVWFYYICLSAHFLDRSSWIKISSLFPLHQKSRSRQVLLLPIFYILFLWLISLVLVASESEDHWEDRLEEEKSYAKAETVSKCFAAYTPYKHCRTGSGISSPALRPLKNPPVRDHVEDIIDQPQSWIDSQDPSDHGCPC